MKFDQLVSLLRGGQSLTSNQQENVLRIIELSRAFHSDAGLYFKDPGSPGRKAIVLESGHQPNFLPYPGVWKKAFLLDRIARELRDRGEEAVPLFGFADHNLSTAFYLARNQVPALNKIGTENIGFKIPERDRRRCFHTLKKPTSERFHEEIERIRTLYRATSGKMGPPGTTNDERTDQILHSLLWSYQRAQTFPEMNAYLFARICTDLFGLNLIFFRYTDIHKGSVFIDTARRVLSDLVAFNASYNAAVAGQEEMPRVRNGDIPFWFHCDCGAKVHLAGDPPSLSGTCPACGKEFDLPAGAGLGDLATWYPRMSPNAIARNLVFAEGLGTSLFISGTGGGLRYGRLADAISREMGFHRPTTLAWRSRDYYLGGIHYLALRELRRTFDLPSGDFTDPCLGEKIRRYRSSLQSEARDLRENQGEMKEIQRLEGRFSNSRVKAVMVKRVFQATPSILDLMAAVEPQVICQQWNTAIGDAGVYPDDHLLLMEGNVSYPCDPGFSLPMDAIPGVYKAMEAIEVD
ncbi:MAG: hypothetical protein LUQ67_02075 [Methanomicrobiales archaeon]|nr:hypothetical protein [Methanomicrobiales archaeon]